LTKNNW